MRSLHVLLQGSVCLVRVDASGVALMLYAARAGEGVAEPSLFAERYHCDAYAATTASVAVYPRKAGLAGLRANPELAMRMGERLAGLVQTTRTRAARVTR